MDLKALDAILVPLDFSATSFGALETALSIAPAERVHLAHVLPVAGGLAWAVGGSAPDAARVEGARQRMLRELTEYGFDPTGHPLHVRVGAPGPEICELSDRIGASLIIIGSHGRGGLEKLILGSVAYDVIRNSRRPVLLERATG